MTAAPQQPSILIVGLPLNGPRPAGVDASVGEAVKAGIAAARQHIVEQSVALDMLSVGPQDDRTPFTEKLTSKRFGALLVGGGIKAMPMCNDLLEFMVNEVKDKSPSTRIYFVTGPDAILDTAQRACKALKASASA